MSEPKDLCGSPAGEDTGAVGTELERWLHSSELAGWCFGCHLCATRCTAARYGVGFDPREILMRARFGLTEGLLQDHSALWQCFRCERCRDFCPLCPAPVDAVAALREGLVARVFGRNR